MYKNVILAALLCCSTPIFSPAQTTDSLWLPKVEIVADRFDISEQYRPDIVQYLSTQNHIRGNRTTVGDLLQSNSRFLVRSYGPGAAQTVGTHGYSSSQIKVVWNGMEINHQMLGLSDLSLIPAILLSDVTVNSTLGSSEYGANAIGGTILLDNSIRGEDYISVGYQLASFQNHSTHLRLNKKLQKWHLNIGFAYLNQENSYPFHDITQNPPANRRRSNAERRLASGSMVFQYTGARYINRSSILYTNSNAQIPGPIVAPSTAAYQDDFVYRLNNTTEFQINPNISSNFGAHYSMHQLDYIEVNSNINSLSKSYNIGTVTNIRYAKTSRNQLRFRFGMDSTWLNTSEYKAGTTWHVFKQFNGLYTVTDRLRVYPSIRFDQYNQFDDAFSFGLGLNIEMLSDKVYFIANFNRNYAPPTYNDLYWPDLGNPDLKPETALKSSVGIKYQLREISISAEYFYSSIDDGIIWSPDNSGRFRPSNINSLLNSGISVDSQLRLSFNSFNVFNVFGWTYLDAKIINNGTQGNTNKGNQIAYQPRHKVTSEIRIEFANMHSDLSYNLMGERFTNNSNTIILDPVHIIDFSIGIEIQLYNSKTDLTFAVLNITDYDYEFIRWYPMPGRSLQISINFKK